MVEVRCSVVFVGMVVGGRRTCPPRWWCLALVVVVCWVGCGCGCVVCLAWIGAVLVPGRPRVGACRVCACPPPWWGVLCRRIWVSVLGVVARSMLGLFCWFAVVTTAVRRALSGVGCLWCLLGVGCLWCLPGRDGQAGLRSAWCASPLCPGRVGRAGHLSACRAPSLVFGSQLLSSS